MNVCPDVVQSNSLLLYLQTFHHTIEIWLPGTSEDAGWKSTLFFCFRLPFSLLCRGGLPKSVRHSKTTGIFLQFYPSALHPEGHISYIKISGKKKRLKQHSSSRWHGFSTKLIVPGLLLYVLGLWSFWRLYVVAASMLGQGCLSREDQLSASTGQKGLLLMD